jgi:hypothetical protein
MENNTGLNIKAPAAERYPTPRSPARSPSVSLSCPFSPPDLSVPGPGVYSAKTQLINGKGSYFPSNLKSNLGRSFGNQVRPSINDLAARQNFPGPGQYVAPSDFPHVTFKNANAGHMQSKMSQSFLNGDGTGADAGAGGDGGNDAKAPHEKTRDSVS